MTEKLEYETISALLTDRKKKKLTPEIVNEINKLIDNPDYGEELGENYVNFIGILRDKTKFSLDQYKRAIMFYTLVESNITLIQSYMQVFPDRVEYRRKHYPERSVTDDLAHEASRYNRSMLVMEIRKLDTISVKLIHRGLLHEAILKQATLMRTARSELVQQKASETLMRELKEDEDTNINLNINDGTSQVLQGLRSAVDMLTQEQAKRIEEGVSVKSIAESRIIQGELADG